MNSFNSIATICTPDHIHTTLSAIYFARKYNPKIDYNILYLDYKYPYMQKKYKNVKIITINDIIDQYNIIANKYGHQTNETRWSLKPVLILFLLNFYHKIIYIDTDIYIMKNINFLFDQIKSMLLSPHYFHNNQINAMEIESKINEYGYFNAGFVGASREGYEPLRYWANCCYNRCEKNKHLGLYDDQKYLSNIYMMKDVFEDIEQINHYGCNISTWNIDIHKNKLIDPVFFHIRSEEIKNIYRYNKEIQTIYNKYYSMSQKINKYLTLIKNEN